MLSPCGGDLLPSQCPAPDHPPAAGRVLIPHPFPGHVALHPSGFIAIGKYLHAMKASPFLIVSISSIILL